MRTEVGIVYTVTTASFRKQGNHGAAKKPRHASAKSTAKRSKNIAFFEFFPSFCKNVGIKSYFCNAISKQVAVSIEPFPVSVFRTAVAMRTIRAMLAWSTSMRTMGSQRPMRTWARPSTLRTVRAVCSLAYSRNRTSPQGERQMCQ